MGQCSSSQNEPVIARGQFWGHQSPVIWIYLGEDVFSSWITWNLPSSASSMWQIHTESVFQLVSTGACQFPDASRASRSKDHPHDWYDIFQELEKRYFGVLKLMGTEVHTGPKPNRNTSKNTLFVRDLFLDFYIIFFKCFPIVRPIRGNRQIVSIPLRTPPWSPGVWEHDAKEDRRVSSSWRGDGWTGRGRMWLRRRKQSIDSVHGSCPMVMTHI